MRDRNETIYRLTVEDIFLTAENGDYKEAELTESVVERVIHKIEAMDFGDMAETITLFIEDAIKEERDEAELTKEEQQAVIDGALVKE